MKKNMQNLIDKKNKILSEMKLIRHSERETIFDLFGVQRATRQQALQIKNYQLKILSFLYDASPEQIQRKMHTEQLKMCKACQQNIESGDLQCRKDANRMIFCNMAYQTITVQEAVILG